MGHYRIRSEKGISLLVNMETIMYAAMKILPWRDPDLACLRGKSAQEVRFHLGRRIQRMQFSGESTRDLRRLKIDRGTAKQIEGAIRQFRDAA